MSQPIEVEVLDRDDICEHGIKMNEFCTECQRRIFYAKRNRNPDGSKCRGWLDDVLDQVRTDVKKERGL